jgi:hypothetical protein
LLGRKALRADWAMLKSALFLVVLLSACASTAPAQRVTQPITNEQGHVIGHKQGEAVTYYTPRVDQNGVLVGYEERVPEGAVIRNLDGRKIGVRYSDLRSRNYNSNKEGISIVVPSAAGSTSPQ